MDDDVNDEVGGDMEKMVGEILGESKDTNGGC